VRSPKAKNVLFITQPYPPRVSTSSRRPACLAKYLPDFGWRPLVLCQLWTPDNCSYDPVFVSGIPDQVVVAPVPVRKNIPGTPSYIYEVIRRVVLPHTVPITFLRRGREAIEELFLQFPIDAIWATAPETISHHLASWASRKWGKPWIADFRDIVNQQYVSICASAIVPVRIFHERRILKTASEIVTVSAGLAEILAHRHGRSIRVIPNGFDPDDEATNRDLRIERFSIVYTGSVLHGLPDFRPLLDALGKLISSSEMAEADIAVEFYGWGNEQRLNAIFKDHPYFSLVRIGGALPWNECREKQRQAAILLNQAFPGRKGIITSKIFEYLSAHRPILAMPADGDCVEALLNDTGAGVSCTTVEELAGQLLKWYREWKKTGTVRSHARLDVIKQYSRREQAGSLSALLDGLTGS